MKHFLLFVPSFTSFSDAIQRQSKKTFSLLLITLYVLLCLFISLIPGSVKAQEKKQASFIDTIVIKTETRYSWMNDSWAMDTKVNHYYNEYASILQILTQKRENDEWLDIHRLVYTYNDRNLLVDRVSELFFNGQWVPDSTFTGIRMIYEYDDRGNMTNETVQQYESGQWKNNHRNLYTYDNDNRRIEMISQTTFGDNWDNSLRIIYAYNNNLVTEIITMSWFSDAWENFSRQVKSYNDNEAETSEYYYIFDEGDWLLSSRYVRTYNEQGKQIEFVSQFHNDGIWVDNYRYTFAYDSQGRWIAQLDQTSEGGNWINRNRKTRIFDDSQKSMETIYQDWENDKWNNTDKTSYFYNDDGTLREEISMVWNQDAWENMDRYDYEYRRITSVSDMEFDHLSITAMPNPFSNTTRLRFFLDHPEIVSLSITDNSGKVEFALPSKIYEAGENYIELSGSDLPQGVYFYNLIIGEKQKTGKIILQK